MGAHLWTRRDKSNFSRLCLEASQTGAVSSRSPGTIVLPVDRRKDCSVWPDVQCGVTRVRGCVLVSDEEHVVTLARRSQYLVLLTCLPLPTFCKPARLTDLRSTSRVLR